MNLVKSEPGVRVYEFEKFADENVTSLVVINFASHIIKDGIRTVYCQERQGLSFGVFFIENGECTPPSFCFHIPKELLMIYLKLDNVPFKRLTLRSQQDFLLYEKGLLPDQPTVHLQSCHIKTYAKIDYPVEISEGTIIVGELKCPSLTSDGTCMVNGKPC